MRTLLFILSLISVWWTFPATAQPAEQDSHSQNELVGTWRADGVELVGIEGEKSVDILHYTRFYPDGTVVMWGPQKCCARGRFEVRHGKLFYGTPGRSEGEPFGVTPDHMWYSTRAGANIHFRRVRDLEPGAVP